ncbi:lysophospholipid acyltransferase LPCAT4-like [Neolamprologus brichardi]|uniref:lysophospholipid acyltransferase LPCAT4-like n=1 Tax=Neolamprologus brichardi TaxID=32507 RepID=UPI001643DB8E|nr:lysophospholipid acyltransferase LPCAT4-like [Neolamprologus brichardi]
MQSQSSRAATQEYPNPFIHELKLTKAQWIKFHPILWLLGRAVFFCVGFHWVKVKGRKADVKEAPILVVAPHSSFLDMVIMFPAGVPSVVSRSENINLPVIGALLECNQSVLVSRRDPESRKEAISELKKRVTSEGSWPQILMFPEGTTTNGRCLLRFKTGELNLHTETKKTHAVRKCVTQTDAKQFNASFSLTLPQDTIRWTYKGSNWFQVLFHTLSQPYTKITIEFLPVYTPSEEEKKNSRLFAGNVQKVMDDTVDLRHIYFNMAALIGHVDEISLFHSAFAAFDREGRGSLTKEELTELMGALLGVPQQSTEELYDTATEDQEQLTEESLLLVLTTHPIYQKVTKEILQPKKSPSANGTSVNNNRSLLNSSVNEDKKSE